MSYRRNKVISVYSTVTKCSVGVQAKSLEVLSVELRGGRAKCPYDPDSNYTIIYVGKPISQFLSPQHAMQNILDGIRRQTVDRSASAGKVRFLTILYVALTLELVTLKMSSIERVISFIKMCP